jgi:MAP/microtubule affinity-regulating kinase
VGIFRNMRKQSDVTGMSSTNPTQPGTSVSAAATDSEASVATVKMGEEGKPRSLRFTFNSNTTSSKPPDEIVAEILKACATHAMQAKAASKYLLECTFTPREGEFVRWEVEVCKLPRLNNLHGLRFKRLSGASTDYKECCERILASVAL